MKNATVEGFPGGCLNACSGSACVQYSSSHSAGKSTSMLAHDSVNGRSRQATALYSLLIFDDACPTEVEAQ